MRAPSSSARLSTVCTGPPQQPCFPSGNWHGVSYTPIHPAPHMLWSMQRYDGDCISYAALKMSRWAVDEHSCAWQYIYESAQLASHMLLLKLQFGLISLALRRTDRTILSFVAPLISRVVIPCACELSYCSQPPSKLFPDCCWIPRCSAHVSRLVRRFGVVIPARPPRCRGTLASGHHHLRSFNLQLRCARSS